MSETVVQVFAAALCVACFVAVVCRVDKLKKQSLKRVRFQFAVLGTGCLAGALEAVFPRGAGLALLAFALLVFLILGAQRWRHGAPEGTSTSPAPLDEADLKHVPGAKR